MPFIIPAIAAAATFLTTTTFGLPLLTPIIISRAAPPVRR